MIGISTAAATGLPRRWRQRSESLLSGAHWRGCEKLRRKPATVNISGAGGGSAETGTIGREVGSNAGTATWRLPGNPPSTSSGSRLTAPASGYSALLAWGLLLS